jgi:hypothetical protein
MHTVIDVRNLNLYQGQKGSDIWTSYKKALNEVLDRTDRSRSHEVAFGRQPEYPSA